MLGRALTSVLWGLVADRCGRKPVIIIGSITVVILNTLFGLTVNFWMAITTRLLLGALNGLLGPIKVLSIPLLTSYTYIAMLSGFSLAFLINCASVMKNVLSVSIITGLFLLQNRAVV
ncbi:hypothetical protein KPL70_014472 [Citrus sinensis]|nr:hypothetical protein KPL70_014472 [Citrus sinensis]